MDLRDACQSNPTELIRKGRKANKDAFIDFGGTSEILFFFYLLILFQLKALTAKSLDFH